MRCWTAVCGWREGLPEGDISCGLVRGHGRAEECWGRRHGDYLASVEVYDPATGEWSDAKHPVPEGLDAEGRDVYELDRVEQPSERWTRLQRALEQLAEARAAVGLERSESSTHLGYCRGAFGFLEQHRRQVYSSRFKQLNSPR